MTDQPSVTPPSPDKGSDSGSEQPKGLLKFWQELRRRKVVRVATVYIVTGWIIIQVASSTFESFGIPIWAFRLVTLMVVLGLPLAVILAWAFELTPEGIKTTKHAQAEQGDVPLSEKQQRKRNWMAYATGAIIPTVIFGAAAVFFYLRSGSSDSQPSSPDGSITTEVEVEYEKSIAVLPFTNMSANQEHAYFADGVHETILTNLANLGDIRVVSRTSVMQYRDTEKPMPVIGEDLNVAYILEGSMQRSGNQFKLTAQLIEASQDNHLWAKDFTGELTDIFRIQAELAKDIATALQAVLSPEEDRQLDRPESASIEAYDLYLRSLETINSGGGRGAEIELLEQAVELDSTFTDAWLLLARKKGTNYINGNYRSTEDERDIKHAVDMAVGLEPDNPMVLIGLAYYYYNCHLDFPRARFYIDQVAEKLPQSSELQFLLASVNRREGNWTEALSHFNRAHLLDPKDNFLIFNIGTTYQMLRDWENAAAMWDKLRTDPTASIRRRFSSVIYTFYAKGTAEEATRFFAKEDPILSLNTQRLWLYQTGNLAAFETGEILDTWESQPGTINRLGTIGYTPLHHAIVLTLLERSRERGALLDALLVDIKQRANNSTEDFRGQLALGLIHALKGNIEAAQTAIDLAVAIRPESSDAFVGVALATECAIVLSWMGKKDEAVAELARLAKKPNAITNYYNLKHSLSLYPLRDHPGFQELLNDPALMLPIPID